MINPPASVYYCNVAGVVCGGGFPDSRGLLFSTFCNRFTSEKEKPPEITLYISPILTTFGRNRSDSESPFSIITVTVYRFHFLLYLYYCTSANRTWTFPGMNTTRTIFRNSPLRTLCASTVL